MADRDAAAETSDEQLRPEHIRAVRLGHGANCSSVGSVIDTLFLSATAGAAIFAAVCAAVEEEAAAAPPPPVTSRPSSRPPSDEPGDT